MHVLLPLGKAISDSEVSFVIHTIHHYHIQQLNQNTDLFLQKERASNFS